MMQLNQFADFSATELESPVAPDLLRRFVNLPLRGAMTWNGLHFAIQTNDARIIDGQDSSEPPQGARITRFNILVDPDLPQSPDIQPIVIAGEPLCWASFGAGLFVFDREAGEMFAFLTETAIGHWKSVFLEIVQLWQPFTAASENDNSKFQGHTQ